MMNKAILKNTVRKRILTLAPIGLINRKANPNAETHDMVVGVYRFLITKNLWVMTGSGEVIYMS